MWRIRQFFRRFKNLLRWLPIIWKDEDWDHTYIYNILKFKLQNQADYLEERNHFVGVEREVEKMRTCIKLLERLKEDYYGDLYHKKSDEKYGKTNFRFEPVEDRPGLTTLETDDSEEVSKGRMEFYMEGAKKHEQARRILFTLLDRNIEKWWD